MNSGDVPRAKTIEDASGNWTHDDGNLVPDRHDGQTERTTVTETGRIIGPQDTIVVAEAIAVAETAPPTMAVLRVEKSDLKGLDLR